MNAILTAETIIVVLVLVATLVAIVARRSWLPYTVSLVLVGLVIAIRSPLTIKETPELILSIFVPPLIFEAAFHLELSQLRDNLAPILILAVPGVLLGALLIGGLVSYGAGLPIATAIVFGALIAATDPVAVVSLFRALGVPRQLSLTVEGESLFNDGTAIVIFQIALTTALTGAFDPISSVVDFGRVALGGLGVGLAAGWLVAQIISRVDDRLIVTTLTTLLAYGAYLIAEQIHVSGVLAVVVAGLVCGSVGMANASPTTKMMIVNLWEYLAFLANSLVFLLIGLNVNLSQLGANLRAIVVAVLAVLVSRALVIYGLSGLAQLRKTIHLPLSWRHVLFWGGLRGALSLALALSLPVTLARREELQAMTFGVVLFTLLAQGTTLRSLLDRLGLTARSPQRLAREARLGKLFAAQVGLRRLEQLHREGLLPDEMWAGLRDGYRHDREQVTEEIHQLFREHAELESEMLLQARRDALMAERDALRDGLRRGLLSDPVYEELTCEIDYRLEALDLIHSAVQGGRRPQDAD